MGFYSTVAIWANRKAIETMPQEVHDLLDYGKRMSLDGPKEFSSGNKVWEWGDVKWHGEDVQKIEQWLASLNADKGELYEFMEIDEDGEIHHDHNHDQCDKLMAMFKIDISDCN